MAHIAGKVVVITGASSGIGEETARVLAEQGARRRERLEALAQAIGKSGGTAIAQVTDVTRRGDVDTLVQRAMDDFGQVDVMINNAIGQPDEVDVNELLTHARITRFLGQGTRWCSSMGTRSIRACGTISLRRSAGSLVSFAMTCVATDGLPCPTWKTRTASTRPFWIFSPNVQSSHETNWDD